MSSRPDSETTQVLPPVPAADYEISVREGPVHRFFATNPFRPRADQILITILKTALLAGFIAWEVILIVAFARLMW